MPEPAERSICLRCSATIQEGGTACSVCGAGTVAEPSRIGPYRLVRLIASTASARVHLAWHEPTRKPVALKVFMELSAREERRFRRHAELLTGFEHPHILPILDYGTIISDVFKLGYVAMRYIEGYTLDLAPQVLNRKIRILADIADALQCAHDHDVVHRDVKPANVLVDRVGDGFITDFGIAKSTNEQATRVTVTGGIIGTPFFMSPEQARGERRIGPASDIFSLGATLYYIVTGHLPYEGALSTIQAVKQVANDPPPRPSSITPEIDPELERTILTAMQPKPEDRYSCAEEMAAALRDYLRGRKTTRRPAATRGMPDRVPETIEILQREAEVPLEAAEKLLTLFEITNRAPDSAALQRIEGWISEAYRICAGLFRADICSGRLELVRKRYDEAIQSFSEAIERHPDLSTGYNHRLKALIAKFRHLRGLPHIYIYTKWEMTGWGPESDEERDLRAAIVADLRMLERTNGREKDERQLQVGGLIDLYEGRYEEAAEKLQEAADLLGFEPECWLDLGMALLLQEKFAEADQAIRRGISIRASGSALRLQASVLFLLGVQRRLEGENPLPSMEEGVASAAESVRLEPEDLRLRRTHSVFRRMLVMAKADLGEARKEDFELLIREAEEIARLQPDDIPSRQGLTSALLAAYEHMDAPIQERVRYLKRANEESRRDIEIDPTSGHARTNLVMTLRLAAERAQDSATRSALVDEALRHADEVILLSRDRVHVFVEKARVLHMADRNPEALASIRRAVELDSRILESSDVRALFEELGGA